MKCPKCDGRTKHTLTDYDYEKQSGIVGLELKGVDTYCCKKCDFKFWDFGDMADVHDEIAKALMGKIVLWKADIKFVQTHFFEDTVFQFAKRIGTEPQTLKMLYKGPDLNIHCRRLSDKVKDAIIREWSTREIEVIFDIE